MKRQSQLLWLTISTRKTTTTSHFKSLNTKNTMTYVDGNPYTDLDMSLYHGWIPVIGIFYTINNLDFYPL